MGRARKPRVAHGGGGKVLLATVVFAALLVTGVACGASDGSGSPSGPDTPAFWRGSAGEVVAQIQLAEKGSRTGMSRTAFCRQPWSGPSSSQRSGARLLLDRAVVMVGGRIFALIVNTGKTVLGYGVRPEVDQLIQGRWHPREFVQDGVPVGFPGVLLELKPRSTSTCLEVPASDSWRPGLYRVWFSVEADDDKSADSALQPTGYFRVSRSAP